MLKRLSFAGAIAFLIIQSQPGFAQKPEDKAKPAANAVKAEDAVGCWEGEERDGKAVYKLSICDKNLCGTAVRAAAGDKRPNAGDLKKNENKTMLNATKKDDGKSWGGPMYIFSLGTTAGVTVEVLEKDKLQVGNPIARREWKRTKCPK